MQHRINDASKTNQPTKRAPVEGCKSRFYKTKVF